MNRVGLGLAIGAGYLLGRTKKLKMAVAVGGLVAGKKLNLSPRMVAELLQQQLKDNPQFKEIGDQLRQDLRGVGKAASGAMVERQIDALADRLHGRTAQVRDQLTGAVPGGRDEEQDDDADAEYDDEDAEYEDEEPEDDEARDDDSEDSAQEDEDEDEDKDEEPAARKAPAKRPSAKKTAKKAPAKKAAAKKAPAKKTAGKKTTAAKKATSGSRGGSARSRLPKGGGEG
ncbi:DNA primase [Streptomyces sp. NPDC088801]|uniref:DNA primase n=1 Tax=Streptomyces sp. NPDC088801 TaxID=3365903 RepID=UPI00380B0D6B